MFTYDFADQEVEPGVVALLCPADFPERATKWICGAGFTDPVAGNHFFVTLMRIGSRVVMTPVFSSSKPYRFEVVDKSGHQGWTCPQTFFDPCQVLVARVEAVIHSAIGAGDRSWPGCRNRVGPVGLAEMLEVIRAHAAAAGRPRDDAA